MDVVAAVAREHGIKARSAPPVPGGFEADCWVLDGRWFVKAWPDDRDRNLAVLDALLERGLPVVPAVRTRLGARSTVVDRRRVAVFPFVGGRQATLEGDWAETAHGLRRVHAVTDIDLPRWTVDRNLVETLRARIDHPWIAARATELTHWLDRYEDAAARAVRTAVREGLCHNDFGGDNLLVDEEGRTIAMLDWDWAAFAPPEHDLWLAIDLPDVRSFLAAYGDVDLDRAHLEYALLRRALGDMAARVAGEVDRAGVDEWGWDRLARLDRTIGMMAA